MRSVIRANENEKKGKERKEEEKEEEKKTEDGDNAKS